MCYLIGLPVYVSHPLVAIHSYSNQRLHSLIDGLIDGLIDWLIDWLID